MTCSLAVVVPPEKACQVAGVHNTYDIPRVAYGEDLVAEAPKGTLGERRGSREIAASEKHRIRAIGNESVLYQEYQEKPITGMSYVVSIQLDPDLNDALDDLSSVNREALEEGLDVAAPLALDRAKRILLMMYFIRRYRYEVYPATKGGVIVDCPYRSGSVMVMCEPDGDIICFLNTGEEQLSERLGSTTEAKYVRDLLRSYVERLGVPS